MEEGLSDGDSTDAVKSDEGLSVPLTLVVVEALTLSLTDPVSVSGRVFVIGWLRDMDSETVTLSRIDSVGGDSVSEPEMEPVEVSFSVMDVDPESRRLSVGESCTDMVSDCVDEAVSVEDRESPTVTVGDDSIDSVRSEGETDMVSEMACVSVLLPLSLSDAERVNVTDFC